MYYLAELATHPSKQGRGYGSALARFVTDRADAQHRATWFLSSNALDTQFYNSLGFVTGANVSVGENDPTWCKPLVVAKLMIREPRN